MSVEEGSKSDLEGAIANEAWIGQSGTQFGSDGRAGEVRHSRGMQRRQDGARSKLSLSVVEFESAGVGDAGVTTSPLPLKDAIRQSYSCVLQGAGWAVNATRPEEGAEVNLGQRRENPERVESELSSLPLARR